VRYSGFMTDAHKVKVSRQDAGLCADCIHARTVESNRGSVFLLCELSRSDSRFVKYPRLPVLSCSGYEKAGEKSEPA